MASFYVLDESRIDRELKVLEARPLVVGAQTRPPQETLFYTSMFGAHMDVCTSYATQEGVYLLGYYDTNNISSSATPEEKQQVRQKLDSVKAAEIKVMQDILSTKSMYM
jgi:hypothetical protein